VTRIHVVRCDRDALENQDLVVALVVDVEVLVDVLVVDVQVASVVRCSNEKKCIGIKTGMSSFELHPCFSFIV
jgi:hypothetical protein